MSNSTKQFVRAAALAEVENNGRLTVQVEGHTVALFTHEGSVFAVDNRCPHMGFPLDQGTLHDGILTCHWHHARFDLDSGGTFDQWADDVRYFPVEIREGEVWVDIADHIDPCLHQCGRLLIGLERDIPLVIGKAVLQLAEGDREMAEPFRSGLEFGAAFRWWGWGQGLTILTCLMNILPTLQEDDRPRALYQGLSAVSRELSGSAPRFGVSPLPEATGDIPTLKRWFRRFIEVRDAEGAERCLVSAIAAGADDRQAADMLFAAATDHRYLQIGHVLDFTNKAFEASDIAGWDLAGTLLTSLVRSYATADRMEESNSWRNPVDLVAILENSFDKLPAALAEGRLQRENVGALWPGRDELVVVILDDDPRATVDAMLAALAEGATEVDLASAVSYAAALRIARFHTSNEFSDWDTALHTFTFANAVEQGLRRAPSVELLRGVFDAAMSVYLDRFLNIPPARLPQPAEEATDKEALLKSLSALLDRQQQVDRAGEIVAHYLYAGGDQQRLMAMMGALLLREDRDFHTIQTMEAAFKQAQLLQGSEGAVHVLVAAVRYLAAHAPTVRSQGQTFEIARRLHRGDRLHV
ncbi:MAG: Rieske 2Fe-2S domain-containing protein [Chloroflexi bacterium]|jgi:nitrite reductase/ring-hydroxylating ferredoxin subunit|nr:Rieske 2Fe-2S domain-containing protein [Chloroflexota bacterium]